MLPGASKPSQTLSTDRSGLMWLKPPLSYRLIGGNTSVRERQRSSSLRVTRLGLLGMFQLLTRRWLCPDSPCPSYRINGKSYTQQAKSSPFSLALQKPGEFMITSVAHQQTMCKTAVTDLHYIIHPMPSVQVAHGRRVLQDIHEGKPHCCAQLTGRNI